MFSAGLFLKKMMVGCMIQIFYLHTLEMAEHQEFLWLCLVNFYSSLRFLGSRGSG